MHRYRNKPVRGILSLEIDFILDCWHWLFLTKVVTFTMSFFCWSYCITIATVKVAYNLYIAKFSKIVQFLCFCYIFLGIISLLAGFRLHTTCLFTATSMLTSKSDWSCKKKKKQRGFGLWYCMTQLLLWVTQTFSPVDCQKCKYFLLYCHKTICCV